MRRRRLDLELVRRGLVATHEDAGAAVAAGRVTVGGRPALRPETLVAPSEAVVLESLGSSFASRGGEKLDAALDRFAVDPSGRRCLDAGASTGGFTDVLLSRGAQRVIAVDVGYGQLDWKLRTDPRVELMERTNVRDLRPQHLPYMPELVTADLSFISLAKVVPVLVALSAQGADLVMLVKPQFEAGREDVGAGGVVEDPAIWREALESVAEASEVAGAPPIAAAASPLLGPAGNVELFLHARVGGGEAHLEVEAAIREGEEIRRVKGRAS